MKKVGNWINGQEIIISNNSKFNVYSPINEENIAIAVAYNEADLSGLLDRIKEAQSDWARFTIKKRVQIMYKLREILIRERENLAECIHLENGKTISEARDEVDKSVEILEFTCSLPIVAAKKNLVVSSGIEVKEILEPIGIVCSVTPYNFPLMVPMWTLPNAIATGNAVILKPSEFAPLTSLKLASLFKEAGLPDGILSVLLGGKSLVESLCKHPGIDAVTFVGSTKVAKAVYMNATSSLKRCLALGGAKNHLIITPDTDPTVTAKEVLSAAFGMAGQRCMAASVVIIVGKNDAFIDELVNQCANLRIGYDIPTMISTESRQKIIQFLENSSGEILVDGRNWPKLRATDIGPSIISYRDPIEMPAEEIFGPTLEIIEVDNIDSAFLIQNLSPYGNGASIFTHSGKIASLAIENLTCGMLGINIGVPVPRDPFSFGGVKESKFGVGDITGEASIPIFTNIKKITTKWNPEFKIDWMS